MAWPTRCSPTSSASPPASPGAQLEAIDGERHRGVVKVKVGPITANYQGVATFVERDAPHRIVVRAEGREARGQGNAAAVITLTLTADGADATSVSVGHRPDHHRQGRPVRPGRAGRRRRRSCWGQFVECLESKVIDPAGPARRGAEVSAPVVDEPATPVDAPRRRRGRAGRRRGGRARSPRRRPRPSCGASSRSRSSRSPRCRPATR